MEDAIAEFRKLFAEQTFSVTQITAVIKELIEESIPAVSVEGEISNYRPSSTGHVYFTLKDSSAAISAVLFKGKAAKLSFAPKDGMLVRAQGQISVYAQRGSYQIVVDTLERAGDGDILKMLEERKRKFAEEGLFDPQNKLPLPRFPRTVAVITSPTGAALRDILQIISRRNPKITVNILPCSVQGAGAAEQIARQIETANTFRLGDVVIIGRGGGSLEDLLPFSEECVIKATAASELPIISAVGHEIDWALSDYAADIRAPTPSAAAELAVPLLSETTDFLARTKIDLEQAISAKTERIKLLVKSFSAESLELRFRSIEQPLLSKFDDAKDLLLEAMSECLQKVRQRITDAKFRIEAANPSSILARGYAMVRDEQTGALITSALDTAPGQRITIQPAAGIITAQIIAAKGQ
ncbi:MAG: exodeoxyribonuclease VII large subunit [Bacteroides sp.]|nr:exodeoxyribonuclease VII large subunit [Prevotella sp.]MCM1407795.1 exodeoxyribonuclease VII large subunit [Treponema brennaborense]MCM1468857.1 exodeoxyribonuclease VII large subunit [Bacteroides sp.]